MAFSLSHVVILMVLSLVVAVASKSKFEGSHQPCSSKMADKIAGMIILGMYGDALGAPTEDAQMKWHPALPPFNQSDRLTPGDGWHWSWPNVWKIWPSPALVGNMSGVTTDDTATRVAGVQLWMSTISSNNRCFDVYERQFAVWAQRQMLTWNPKGSWMEMNQYDYFGQTLCMWSNATEGRYGTCQYANNPFYTPKEAISFGLYMYLEYSGTTCFSAAGPSAVYDFFLKFCSLDALHAKEMTAFGAALLGSGQRSTGASWSQFLFNGLRLMKNVTLREDLLVFWALGVDMKTKDSSARDVEIMYRKLFLDPNVTQAHPMRAHDPLYLFRIIYMASGYSGDDLATAFTIITNSPGDTDTTASYFGLIIGSFLGRSALPTWIPVEPLLHFQQRFFNFNLTERVQLYCS